ncbi:MAG: hypothetical protein QM711_13990 [Micropruina sp.]|uniref:COG4705 family protein n=1 Tax=Micropruina sp. TaxID=2737536 RepID=UPI0039E6EB21
MTINPAARQAQDATARFLNKVPVITATFWLIKVLSTTVGETFADFLTVQVGLGPLLTGAAMLAVLVVTLIAQLRAPRYVPWLYWLTVVEVSIVGTQLTDFFTDQLGVSLYLSTAVFAVALALVFVVWWQQERTLAITAIDTPKRERFYWAAILVTFALGTAGGDLANEALSLGFRTGSVVFGGLIVLVWVMNRLGMNGVTAFWIAYVLTRPLGASLGDLLTQESSYGGVGLGAGLTSALFLTVIVVLVAREQVNVNRHGVREKGDVPVIHPRRDYAWAAGGTLGVVLASVVLTSAAANNTVAIPAPSVVATSSTGASGIEADATSPLGDLRPFVAIVSQLKVSLRSGDFPGITARAKDLEVAWDSAEAAIKPASPADWHALDSAIDQLLTAVRATAPSVTAIDSAITGFRDTVSAIDQKQ